MSFPTRLSVADQSTFHHFALYPPWSYISFILNQVPSVYYHHLNHRNASRIPHHQNSADAFATFIRPSNCKSIARLKMHTLHILVDRDTSVWANYSNCFVFILFKTYRIDMANEVARRNEKDRHRNFVLFFCFEKSIKKELKIFDMKIVCQNGWDNLMKKLSAQTSYFVCLFVYSQPVHA